VEVYEYPLDIFGRFSVDMDMWILYGCPMDILDRFSVDMDM